jgi:hypothetical protein
VARVRDLVDDVLQAGHERIGGGVGACSQPTDVLVVGVYVDQDLRSRDIDPTLGSTLADAVDVPALFV